MDILEQIDQYLEDEMICEIKYKKVIRNGKVIRKAVCPDGFKAKGGRCVKMTAKEKLKRSRSTKRSQKKVQASGKKAQLIRSRAKSMRKRKAIIPNAQSFPKALRESMSRHCFIYKAKNGKWYMELAPDEYGEQHSADLYGPFNSEEAADDYLDYFSNPGGLSLDKSGKMPVPKRAPNGSPIIKPKKGGFGF